MVEWQEYTLGELLQYEQPTAYIVESTDYDDNYKIPVLTAGKTFILGYTNEKQGIYDALPVIIFDDFTTASRYVNFKFKVKSSAMKILTANTELVLPKFIFYRMQIIKFDASTHKRYWIQHYSKIKVKIPPTISEQERVVSRIEELFSQLDASVAELKTAKERLKVYRQAVYHDVIDSFKSKKYILSDVVTTIEGDRGKNYPKRKDFQSDGDCLFLTAKNVRPYGWRFESNIFISAEKDRTLRSGKLQRNDIVITTRGTLGNVAVYDEAVPYENMRINSCMLILRINSNLVSPYYLAFFLMSPVFKAQIDRLKSGTAQPQIPANVLRNTMINIPSLSDQKKVIAELSQRFSICDNIEKTVDTALQQAEALRQSILKKAFEGRLV